MDKNLSILTIERQNVLNNRFAVETIQKTLNVEAIFFEGQYCFTKQMVAGFYEVEERTIERYLLSHESELKHNGYFLCKGKLLKKFKLQYVSDINVGKFTPQIGLFNFRAFLNIGMLISESEKAKQVRSLILDIVIATIHERAGGGTKYINRRDVNYIPSAIAEINYRKSLTSAINQCVDGHQTMKYAQITDYVYKAVFKENAKEYRKILKLKDSDKPRETMYSEILLMIAAFENGVGYEIRKKYNEKSGGGFSGIRDREGIESVLDFVQDDLYYPGFVSKLNYLVFRFCSGHFFNDGNKRIALTLGTYFLHKNGHFWAAAQFMQRMEAIVYHIAASNIDNELLLRIMTCVVDCQDFDEGLKIDIINALQKSEVVDFKNA